MGALNPIRHSGRALRDFLTLPGSHRATTLVLKTMCVFGGVRALTILCSLVRNKLIAVLIGPAGVGLVGLYNSVSDLMSTVTRLNVDQSATRDLARSSREEEADVAYVVRRWSGWLALVGMVIMCALSPVLSLLSFGTVDLWWTYCVLSIVPASYALSMGQQSIMQGLRRFNDMARVSMVTAIAGIILTIPLVYFLREKSIVWVIVAYSLSMLGASLYYRVRLPRADIPLREVWRRGSGFIRLGFWITAGLAITQLCNYLFILFINDYASTDGLGIFQAGYTIMNTYVAVLFTGVWVEYFPRLTAVIHSPERVATVVSHRIVMTTWILIPVAAIFMASDSLIVRIIYSSDFLTMIPYITIGMAGMGLRAASWCIAHTILARGDGKIYVLTETVSGVICLVGNIIGFSFGGFYGLGISYVVWYGLYLTSTYVVYRYVYGFRLRPGIRRLVGCALLFAAICAISRIFIGWWLPLILGIVSIPLAVRRLMA